MATLIEVNFKSVYKIDNETETVEFCAKGYKSVEDNKLVIYFKKDNAYKFIIEDNSLIVHVDESIYVFDFKTKTEAIIRMGEYSYKAPVNTKNLSITNNNIDISYEIDFGDFKGEYQITLELL